jgi:hypothetical protein
MTARLRVADLTRVLPTHYYYTPSPVAHDGEVAEWSNAAVLKTCKWVFRQPRIFLSKSSKALSSMPYKPIGGFAASGKEWHDKAVTLPFSANWNPLENPMRHDLGGDWGRMLLHVGGVIVPLAASGVAWHAS